MKVLIEIGHPAHVHFFSRAILRLKKQGHGIHIVTRNKEITDALLQRLAIPFQSLSKPARSGVGMAFELFSRWIRIARILLRERIDVAVSISGISTSFPAWLTRTRNLVFTDTEDAKLSNRIAFPFADRIFTPSFYAGDLGRRHLRYDGLHELAYLRDFDFAAARAERARLGLPERYSIVRIVKLDALHDQDVKGIDEAKLAEILALLEKRGRVFLSSGEALGPRFSPYLQTFPIESMHAVMAGCQVFVGESPTMAVEASLLGRPAFLVSSRADRLGNMIRLRAADLLRCYPSWESFLPVAEAEIESGLASDWDARAETYRRESVDVSGLVENAILGRTKKGGD